LIEVEPLFPLRHSLYRFYVGVYIHLYLI